MAPATVLISGLGIAGSALAYWLARRGHRPILVERNDGLRAGGHAVDIRGTALDVVERMGLDNLVRILHGAVSDDADVRFGDTVRALVPVGSRVCVEFEHGHAQEVDLVVGADGQHSNIRERVRSGGPVHLPSGRRPVDLHHR